MRKRATFIIIGLLVGLASLQAQGWSQIGGAIEGEASRDHFGESLSISDDGSVVAIGAPGNNGNGTDAGRVRIFENQGGTWSQIGGAIEGGAAGDRFGATTSISDDGSVVAIGAPYNDGNGYEAGHVRIFEKSGVSNEPPQQQGFSLYPNPTSGELHLEVENASRALNMEKVQKITVCDMTGKQLLEKTQVQPLETIDISGLESGMYIISVQTGDKVFTWKIIKG